MHRIPLWKRVLDLVCIIFILPFALPLMLLIGIFIRISSPGPVLFKQERIGYLGRKFVCLKFRTMKVNAETSSHQGYLNELMNSDSAMIKLDTKGDPRVIRGGLLIRSGGFDELPQIFNVLMGEMSLVGPRPCIPYEYEQYLPEHRRRFNTLPGLTGMWQVNGKNRTTFNQMMQFDIFYAEKKTLWLDVKILFLTLPAIIGQVRDNRKKPVAPVSVSRLQHSNPVGKKNLIKQPTAH